MSLARKYNRLFKKYLNHYAAWSPITDAHEVGDYGGLHHGVFVKIGNIREFGVDPEPRAGSAVVSFSFASIGTHIVRTVGGVAVDMFPGAGVEAELSVGFQRGYGLFIRTAELSVMEMPSVDVVASQLGGRRDAAGRRWQLCWRVVRRVYTADGPTILMSMEKATSFRLRGRADALRALEVGHASVDIAVESQTSNTLQIIGGKGPIALDLD